MSSEVAQLGQRIEEEISLMCVLMNGLAVVSKHMLIMHKCRSLAMYQQELAQLVGKQSAELSVNEIHYQMMEGDGKPCNHE